MDENGNMNPERAVKEYRKEYLTSAYHPVPSDVRSPEALAKTLDYLVNEILSKHPLEK
ncbi:hypothetical protein ABG067_008954 [Albugo candida]